jgi:hypothetical protein
MADGRLISIAGKKPLVLYRKGTKMNGKHSKAGYAWTVVAILLGLGLLLSGCGTPEPPTSEPDSPAAAPQGPGSEPAALEITGHSEEGTLTTLYIAASDVEVLAWFDEEAETHLGETFAQTPYLEYALLYDDGGMWRFYYAQPPAGIATPMQTQMHLLQSVGAGWSLFASSPDYVVSEAIPITGTAGDGSAILLQDGIDLINDELGGMIPLGQAFSQPPAFLLLSDGAADNAQYALISLIGVQSNGEMKFGQPGDGIDFVTYCNSPGVTDWWCVFFR